jgi:uncharacterized membrane protein YeaQ/YmgE (transglycosylase-associated protein family)
MHTIAWLALGLLAGFLSSRLVKSRGSGVVHDLVLGIAGALVGGFLFVHLGARGVTGLNAWSLLVAVVGAVVLLVAARVVRRVARA